MYSLPFQSSLGDVGAGCTLPPPPIPLSFSHFPLCLTPCHAFILLQPLTDLLSLLPSPFYPFLPFSPSPSSTPTQSHKPLNPPYFSHSSQTPYHLRPLQPIPFCVLCIFSQPFDICASPPSFHVSHSPVFTPPYPPHSAHSPSTSPLLTPTIFTSPTPLTHSPHSHSDSHSCTLATPSNCLLSSGI